jgi:type IV fimbrial biogenesis protein FimT
MNALRNGFTLIEAMITLAVFGVLTALALPSFQSWLANSQIRTAAEGVQNGLQLARNQALTMNARVQFELNAPAANDWTISTAATPTTAIQTRVNLGATPQASISSTITGATPTVTFNGLGKVAGASPTATTFSISNPTGGTCQADGGSMRCLNVTVQTGGQIRICDPNLPSTNPQSC